MMNIDLFDQHILDRLQRSVMVLGILGIAVGCIVLIGWFFSIETLKTIFPNLASMKFNTALAFTLLGFGLLLVRKQPTVAQILAIGVILIGGLSLSQYIFGWELGIDQLIVQDLTSTSVHPGRMSVVTAILLCLTGLCVLLTARGQSLVITQILAISIASVALFALLGYFFDVNVLYNVRIFSTVALHTAVNFLVLSLGIFFVFPDRGIAATVFMNRAGGRMVRQFLVIIIILPMVFALLILKGFQIHLYDIELGMALLTIANIILLSSLTIWTALSLNHTDIERDGAMLALQQLLDEQELIVQKRTAELRYAKQSLEQEIHERERLQQEHEYFFALSIDMLMIAGFDGYFKYVSPAFERTLGYSSSQLLARPIVDFIHPDDIEILNSEMNRLSEGGSNDNFEIRFHCTDASYKWTQWTAQPLVYHGLIYGIGRDITDEKEAEATLRTKIDEEQKLLSYMKALQDIMVELTNINILDEFYKKTVELGLNVLGFERLGLLLYDSEEDVAIGTYGTDKEGRLVDEHDLRVHPSDLTNILLRAFERDEHFVLDEDADLYSNFEFIGKGWNAVAVLWNGTEKLGWLAVDNGVFHRPQSQAQLEILALYALNLGSLLAKKQLLHTLEESETRYRLVLSAMSDGVVLQDRDGTIQANNTAAEHLLGLSSDQMRGRSSIDPRWRAIHEDGSPFPGETHPPMLSLQTGQAYSDVIMGIHKPDNTLIWILVNSQPMFHTGETQPYAVVTSFTDITHQKREQEQALTIALEKERVKLLGQFIRDSSHEFRTPLTIIKSTLYILSRTDDPERRRSKVDVIDVQIDRITKLVDMLVMLSELDSDTIFIESSSNLNVLVRDICNSTKPEYVQKGLSLSLDLAENLPSINIDRNQISEAIHQLLHNAIRFTESGGSINVSTEYDSEHVKVVIQDTGSGISEEALPRIFERFYRQDDAHSTPGFGLGLAIAQKIAELHGGNIYIETTVGEGSTFQIVLPINQAHTT